MFSLSWFGNLNCEIMVMSCFWVRWIAFLIRCVQDMTIVKLDLRNKSAWGTIENACFMEIILGDVHFGISCSVVEGDAMDGQQELAVWLCFWEFIQHNKLWQVIEKKKKEKECRRVKRMLTLKRNEKWNFNPPFTYMIV